MELRTFQQQIEALYGERDRRRGVDATFRWLAEEVGELARALRSREPQALREEVSDVVAWTVSVATLMGVDVEAAVSRYAAGCPKCGQIPCACPESSR
jgi:NTP pyrophosphatase (non-canonical NTP hydrolase)